VLERGSFRVLDAPDGVFAFERRHAEQRAVIALNFEDDDVVVSLGDGAPHGGLRTGYGEPLPPSLARVELGPAQGIVLTQGPPAGS
jgi:hypothetical protein